MEWMADKTEEKKVWKEGQRCTSQVNSGRSYICNRDSDFSSAKWWSWSRKPLKCVLAVRCYWALSSRLLKTSLLMTGDDARWCHHLTCSQCIWFCLGAHLQFPVPKKKKKILFHCKYSVVWASDFLVESFFFVLVICFLTEYLSLPQLMFNYLQIK